jgi:hypothetical protein
MAILRRCTTVHLWEQLIAMLHPGVFRCLERVTSVLYCMFMCFKKHCKLALLRFPKVYAIMSYLMDTTVKADQLDVIIKSVWSMGLWTEKLIFLQMLNLLWFGICDFCKEIVDVIIGDILVCFLAAVSCAVLFYPNDSFYVLLDCHRC